MKAGKGDLLRGYGATYGTKGRQNGEMDVDVEGRGYGGKLEGSRGLRRWIQYSNSTRNRSIL
jgi:hypothetical protein